MVRLACAFRDWQLVIMNGPGSAYNGYMVMMEDLKDRALDTVRYAVWYHAMSWKCMHVCTLLLPASCEQQRAWLQPTSFGPWCFAQAAAEDAQ